MKALNKRIDTWAESQLPTHATQRPNLNWAALAVATAFQVSSGFELLDKNVKSKRTYSAEFSNASIHSSPLATNLSQDFFMNIGNVSTTLYSENLSDDPNILPEDIAVKSIYTKEFKVGVGVLTIDRSLPKIFAD